MDLLDHLIDLSIVGLFLSSISIRCTRAGCKRA